MDAVPDLEFLLPLDDTLEVNGLPDTPGLAKLCNVFFKAESGNGCSDSDRDNKHDDDGLMLCGFDLPPAFTEGDMGFVPLSPSLSASSASCMSLSPRGESWASSTELDIAMAGHKPARGRRRARQLATCLTRKRRWRNRCGS